MEDPFAASPIARSMAARILAQGQVIELLLGLLFTEKGDATKSAVMNALRNSQQATPMVLSDPAAEWWADVQVQSKSSLEGVFARADQVSQGLRGPGSSAPSA